MDSVAKRLLTSLFSAQLALLGAGCSHALWLARDLPSALTCARALCTCSVANHPAADLVAEVLGFEGATSARDDASALLAGSAARLDNAAAGLLRKPYHPADTLTSFLDDTPMPQAPPAVQVLSSVCTWLTDHVVVLDGVRKLAVGTGDEKTKSLVLGLGATSKAYGVSVALSGGQ